MISEKTSNGSASPSRSKPSPSSILTSTSGQRALMIVAGLVSLFFFTKVFLPPDHSPFTIGQHQIQRTETLVPRNYLNITTASPPPFDFCPIYGPGDALATKYGAHNLARGRIYTGSGARIQRVIHKALSGLPVTISVLGGSVSACHGAGDNPISPRCYPARLFNWWNSVFPHPASELTNGAMRKTNSAYFSFCSAHHLPDQTDLVILEFASDDPKDPAWIDHFDLLVRSILQRPDQPAILVLGHFSPQMHAVNSYNDALHMQTVVAQFYDVPIVSIKGVIFNDFISNPSAAKTTYWVDPILANPLGHELLGDVLISYFQEMTCKGWDAAVGRGFEVPVMKTDATAAAGAAGLFGGVGGRKGGENGPGAPGGVINNPNNLGRADASYAGFAALRVPPIRTTDRSPISEHFREPKPFCVSANDLINPLPPSLFYGSGWHSSTPTGGRSVTPDQAGAQGYYWHSTLPTSKLRVPVKLHAGDVAIYYMMEPRPPGLKQEELPGVACWVDDNVAGGVEIYGQGDVGASTPNLQLIDRGVDAGSHFVECMLLGEEGETSPMFKLLGVFVT